MNDYNPTRTFYFFRVNLYNGVLSLLDHSYKVCGNEKHHEICFVHLDYVQSNATTSIRTRTS